MKVLAGPRLDLHPAGLAARVCAQLAGDQGEVIPLAELGVRNPYRRFSAAEVDALRRALRGAQGVVGYVCTGVLLTDSGSARGVLDPARGEAPRLVLVADHVNLTWWSPLTGPNDDGVGPRFPSMDSVYLPEAALPGSGEDGMIVARGVVAGVPDDRALSEYQTKMSAGLGWVAASSELVAPAIVAAHLGLRVAAVVMV